MSSKNEKIIKLKLNIEDRLIIASFIPKEGDLLQMTIAKELRDKLSLTRKEMESINLKSSQGAITWESENAEEINNLSFSLNESEIRILKDQVEELTKSRKITLDTVSLANRIKDLSIDANTN